VLAVLDDRVVSPPAGKVLEGVSLRVVAELCQRLGLPFVRCEIDQEELDGASEILLSNTTDCLVGVSRLDGRPVPIPGPILLSLLDAWSNLVGVDLRQQMAGES
jgi:branched-subunit amino acid aminotransferase/4-amino-4-deoxychorismate lyase